MRIFYLSFASDKFLGACVVQADSLEGAHKRATELGINPGGQVLGWDVTQLGKPPYPMNRLMSRTDMEAVDGGPGKSLKEMGDDADRVIELSAGMICDKH